MGASEFQVFSNGEVGRMHVLAHRLVDEQRYALGHRFLGEWLDGRKEVSSDDVHLQWHMGVFELAVGEWDAAYARFNESILPAVERGNAKTDAPAMLWRLQLDAPSRAILPWEVVRKYTVENLPHEADDFIVLHHLLALSGSGDVSALDRWIDAQAEQQPGEPRAVTQLGEGLRAFVNEDYSTAAEALRNNLTHLAQIGGSDAQRLLFRRIAERAVLRS